MAQVTLPYNLTAGSPENVNNLMSNLNALKDGVNTVDTAQIANSAVTPAKAAAAVVSSLPTTGLVDGMEVSYQSSDMATDGLVWRFKYRSGSSSSYKWEFVGGAGWYKEGGGGTTSSSTYQNTNSPSITLPALAGDYEFTFGAKVTDNQVGYATTYVALHDDGSPVSGDVACGSTDPGQKSVSRVLRVTGIGASSVMDVRYKSNGSLSRVFGDVFLHVRPIRVI